MWQYLIEDMLRNEFALLVIVISILLSLISLILINRYKNNMQKKLNLIYIHLFLLFLPLIFISIMWSCQISILGCIHKTLLWALPISVLLTFVLGFFVLPNIHRITYKSKEVTTNSLVEFVKDYSKTLGIKQIPKIYFIDTGKPVAYSFTNFKPSIFISVGMFEMFKQKELEAVILHELHHIRTRSSLFKFSTQFARFISPVVRFASLTSDLREEEANADNFAVKIQKTDRYLMSAKRKIRKYTSE